MENVNEVKMITIEYDKYVELCIAQANLWQLEAAGVDNWDGYGCNCEDINDECIFCANNEKEFLGL